MPRPTAVALVGSVLRADFGSTTACRLITPILMPLNEPATILLLSSGRKVVNPVTGLGKAAT